MHLSMLSPYNPNTGWVGTKLGFDNSTMQIPHLKRPYWALLSSANQHKIVANV